MRDERVTTGLAFLVAALWLAFIVMLVWLVLRALLPSRAEAHCYSIWKYPYPQRCGVSAPRVRVAVARVQVREVEPRPAPLPVEPPADRRPDVPLLLPTMISSQPVPPPPVEWDDEAMRAIAIERLKEKMNK